MSREDVGALWRLADADGWRLKSGLQLQRPPCCMTGNGRLDLNEFVGLLRQAQLEALE